MTENIEQGKGCRKRKEKIWSGARKKENWPTGTKKIGQAQWGKPPPDKLRQEERRAGGADTRVGEVGELGKGDLTGNDSLRGNWREQKQKEGKERTRKERWTENERKEENGEKCGTGK
ncbi:hypothetical protein [Nonomuraea dietziae]|uniref:hypothetical protein n=1 Tax=Nonomuraea dietziae TaxID=65515 RepID=UPI0031D8CADB